MTRRSTVYFDCETHLITPDNPVPPLVCLQYAIDDGPVQIVLACDGAVEIARKWLESDDIAHIVSHNGFFDWSVLGLDPWEALEKGKIRDTLILGQLHAIEYDWMRANPADNWAPPDFSLACLAWTFCDLRLAKGADTWRLRYAELENTPVWAWPPAAVEYAEKDVTVLRDVYRALTERGWSSPDEARQTTTAWCLRLMEVWGITTSPAAVERLRAVVEPTRKEAVEHLLACGFMSPGERTLDTERRERAILLRDPNPPRTPTGRVATGAAYMRSLGLPTDREAWLGPPGPPKKNLAVIRERVRAWYTSRGLEVPETEKGSDSTERAVLAATDDPDLLVLANVGEVEKITTTYMPVFERRRNHPRWNCLVATGRVSVSRPNLNNIPRELYVGGKKHSIVREVFTARRGYAYIDADYSQAELCALAQVTYEMFGYSAMREVIHTGKDLHAWFASNMLNEPYDTFTSRLQEGDKDAKYMRTLAKCFHPDTEVLTRKGWKKIAQVTCDEEIAAASMQDDFGCKIIWERPTRLTSRPSPGHLVHLYSEGIDLRVTEDHRMAGWRANGKAYQPAPLELGKARYWPNAGMCDQGDSEVDERLLRLAVAVQADGTYGNGLKIRLGFSKERKIARLKEMLRQGEYSVSQISNGKWKDTTWFTLSRDLSQQIKRLLTPDKEMPWWWLGLSPNLRDAVLDEARHWDSYTHPNGTSYGFSSYKEQNLDVLQALSAITNRKASAHDRTLSVRRVNRSRGGNLNTQRIPYEGEVYCLTVPSDALIVRDGGKVVVTHQCANFGYPGGLGPKKFVQFALDTYGVVLTIDRARELKEMWLEAFPEVRRMFAWVNGQMQGAQSSFTLEQIRSGRRRGGCGYCDGNNSLFQGLTADGAKAALRLVTNECYRVPESPLFGSRIVAFIYDEILLETPEERVGTAAERLQELMVQGMSWATPDVPVVATMESMYHWTKSAKVTRNERGLLVPFDKRLDANAKTP